MYSIRKMIIISFLTIQTGAFALPPIDNCNMNGIWYMEMIPVYQFQVVQSGSSIIITTPTWPPEKQLIGAGSMLPSGVVSFYLEGKAKHTNFKGTFIRLCSAMIWQSLNIFGKVEEYTMLRMPIKIVEPIDNDLVITSEPRMPNFNAKVVLDNPLYLKELSKDIPTYSWSIQVKHDIGSDMHIDAYLEKVDNDSDSYRPNFNLLKETKKDGSIVDVPGGVVGGELTLSVDYYRNLHIEKKYTILKGTNPGQGAIEQVLTDKTLRQIACQESHYKQFIAAREGGIGKLNTKDGSRGGVGIMQLYEPIPRTAEVWNWRENLRQGIDLYKEKIATAHRWPVKEFRDLNKERAEKGLPTCVNPLPPFNSEQLEREIIRLFNCGHEYRWEPRDEPTCEGRWVQSLSCQRDGRTGYDPKYVDNVLKCDINH